MSFPQCRLIFQNAPTSVFFGGQTVKGTVECTLDKPKTIQALNFQVKGFAKVAWTEHNGSSSIEYTGKEEYFTTTTSLVTEGGKSFVLSEGCHSYNFTFLLPEKLPSSFESKDGAIRYVAQVIMERPWKFDQKSKVAFTVLAIVDLNAKPSLLLPINVEESKKMSSLFSKSGTLTIYADLPSGAYVSGQTIPVSILLNNESKISIEQVLTRLKQVVLFTAYKPSKKKKLMKTILDHVISDGVGEDFKNKIDLLLKIPSVLPSTTNLCKIIDISYHIKVKCVMSGMNRDCKLKIPIVIGSSPQTVASSNAGPSTSQQPPTVYNYRELPPPYTEFFTEKSPIVEDDESESSNSSNMTKDVIPQKPHDGYWNEDQQKRPLN